MNEWLQILLILFVVWWTARAARNKGHNMLIWATLSAIPAVGLVPGFPDGLTALCMFPMLALMFVPARRPVEAEEEEDTTVACPRCQHVHDPGPSFCTNCGWELARVYASEDGAADPAEATATTLPSGSETVGDSPGIAEEGAAPTPVAEPVLASTQNNPATPEPVGVGATADAVPGIEPISGFTAEPLKISLSLTAAGMTERGLALVNQGRVREAVDQFTKAIALDPRYREAWANRAKAYSELGLSEKAAADRQQLEAI